jgi:hypothetical protein
MKMDTTRKLTMEFASENPRSLKTKNRTTQAMVAITNPSMPPENV